FASVRRGIETRCEELGMTIPQVVRGGVADAALLHKLDGLIMVGSYATEELASFYPNLSRVVLVNNIVDDPNIDTVKLNFRQAMEDVLEHLIRLGHTSIGCISGQEHI